MCSLFSFQLLLIFSIFFYQNPLFSFEMEILTSQKGKPQLALDGFLYIIDKNDKKIYWKCVRNPECRGRAISNKKGCRKIVLYWLLINVRYLKLSKKWIIVVKLMIIKFSIFLNFFDVISIFFRCFFDVIFLCFVFLYHVFSLFLLFDLLSFYVLS